MTIKNKRKILIVEDEELILHLYEENIPKDKCDIVLSKDGLDAIGQIDKKNFDLILLDIMMPKMNGWDVLEYIRKKKKLKVPVIILSNLAQDSDKEKAKKLGATSYLVKSDIGFNDLMDKIISFLK